MKLVECDAYLHSTVGIDALCFSTRASVETVLSMWPCIFSYLSVNEICNGIWELYLVHLPPDGVYFWQLDISQIYTGNGCKCGMLGHHMHISQLDSIHAELHWINIKCRADSRLATAQWETALLCNAVSHWLGAKLESALKCICILSHSSTLKWHRWLKSFLMEDKDGFILHSQYQGCWWHGNVRARAPAGMI